MLASRDGWSETEDGKRNERCGRAAKAGECGAEYGSRGGVEDGVKGRRGGRNDVIVEGCPGNGEAVRVGTPSCVATAAAT